MGKDVHALTELKLPSKDYVLVLPGWYPTWLDPMPGDFNQRHVKAAGLYKPQVVLYIGKDQTKTLTQTEVRYHQLTEQVVEIRVVYPEDKVRSWDVIQSNIHYIKLLYQYADLIQKYFGKPRLLHAYIVMRGGFGAWLLSKKWKLPFILTENWTIYYPEDPGYYKKRNFIFKWLVKRVFKNVSKFLPVTSDLQSKAQSLFSEIPSTVIPNVVETSEFYFTPSPAAYFRFVHVSTMVYQKNPEGLLRAFAAFQRRHPGAVLWMVGPYPPGVKRFANELGLTNDVVHFTGAISYGAVADILHQSHALVLFSRYENLPCVILEAHCCGLPVISTDVGGIAEVIDETNGLQIESGKEDQLQQALEEMYTQYRRYDHKKIAETATARFSYEAVGRQINAIYNELT